MKHPPFVSWSYVAIIVKLGTRPILKHLSWWLSQLLCHNCYYFCHYYLLIIPTFNTFNYDKDAYIEQECHPSS